MNRFAESQGQTREAGELREETGQGKLLEGKLLMLFGSVLDEREHRTRIILDRILG